MTKHIHTTARGLQQILLGAPWPIPAPPPPELQIAADGWRALCAWHWAGEHVYRVRGDESPLIQPDLLIADQRLRRDGQAYIIDGDQWIVLGRIPAGRGVPIGADIDRSIGASHPALYWCAGGDGGIETGCTNLADQPTMRDLRIVAGLVIGESGERLRCGNDLAGIGVMLARVLPLFLDSTARS